VTYAKAFFDLQLDFARKVSALGAMPFARAVLQYTNFYIRFGLGRDFDPGHPRWNEFIVGLRDAKEAGDWTYQFYLTRTAPVAPPDLVATFGCFSYGRLGRDRIRLHFHNAETEGQSPLGKEREGRRRTELVALFEHVKATEQQPLSVLGASWLYNLNAYRRLFPASYLSTAHVIRGRFQHLPLWGQFVDRHGQVKNDLAQRFRERLARQSSTEELDQCFPVPVLALEAPAMEFFEYYGI
jgi:hypothetical protein